VLTWSLVLLVVPAVLLGMVSPGCVEQCRALGWRPGAIVGPLSAASTIGAVVGTLLTGTLLLRTLGMYRTLFLLAILLAVAALLVAPPWRWKTVSAVVGSAIMSLLILTPEASRIDCETNYFTIRIIPDTEHPSRRKLQLDRLVHSVVDLADPLYLHYRHEQIQRDFLLAGPAAPQVLVIGGGGYTFPRAAATLRPQGHIDVVEIDPVITRLAIEELGLDPKLRIRSFAMDGRQFLAQRDAVPVYDLITMDAVNDLSVPGHLLTVECHKLVREALAPEGVYLVSVIDAPAPGGVLAATIASLREVFPEVELLSSSPDWQPGVQAVHVIAARHEPPAQPVRGPAIFPVPLAQVTALLTPPPPILTDDYAPVDQLLLRLYRHRKE
ncbi:MAG: fused MFS/spermidine synthase, partial [Gemmataceae bacterium]